MVYYRGILPRVRRRAPVVLPGARLCVRSAVPRSPVIQTRLPDGPRRLDSYAAVHGLNRSEAVRRLLDAALTAPGGKAWSCVARWRYERRDGMHWWWDGPDDTCPCIVVEQDADGYGWEAHAADPPEGTSLLAQGRAVSVGAAVLVAYQAVASCGE